MMLPTIDELLLRDRVQIVNIAKFISYKHNPLLPLYSVKVTHQLSLKQDKLVSIFLEAQEELTIITGYAEKLETDEPDTLEPGR